MAHAKRSTIARSPLEAAIPTGKPETSPRGRLPQKVRFTAHVPADLADKVRDACVATYETVASFTEKALKAELVRLQGEKNKGRPFPSRSGRLKTGRPIGTA